MILYSQLYPIQTTQNRGNTLKMNENEARKLLKEFLKERNLPMPKLKFYPKPKKVKRKGTVGNVNEKIKSVYSQCFFDKDAKTCWIEFYGEPTFSSVKEAYEGLKRIYYKKPLYQRHNPLWRTTKKLLPDDR